MSDNSSVSDIDNEPLRDYRVGGYYPVSIGEVFNNRYKIIKKLGWGVYSTAWLSYDYDDKNHPHKVLKIQKAEETNHPSTQDEIDIVSKMDGCRLLDNFTVNSLFGTHIVLVFPHFGENLLTSIRSYNYNGIKEDVVRKITYNLLISLQYIHEDIKIIHTDIKPENILVRKPPKDIRKLLNKYKVVNINDPIKLIDKNDFILSKTQRKRKRRLLKMVPPTTDDDEYSSEEENEYLERINDVVLVDFGNAQKLDDCGDVGIQTRQYRSPEVIIAEEYDTSADIWSLGCVIYELLIGENLFECFKGKIFDEDDSHISLMLSYLEGDFTVYKNSINYHIFFDDNNQFIPIKNIRKVSLKTKLKKHRLSDYWYDILSDMFVIDYKKRPTARDLLKKYIWLCP